jgi:hypothetical protein
VLRAIGIIYVVMAAVSIVVGLIAAGYILASQPWSMTTRVVWAIVSLAGTCFAVIGSLAVAEVLKLFMDIEHNTRTYMTRPSGEAIATSVAPGRDGGHVNRILELDEETAEGALIRGH